ncbi:MAG: hypothetical protein E8G75_03655, partial [Sulfitobacter sp. SK025]
DNRDFSNVEAGLRSVGFDAAEVAGIMGENWLRFFDASFGPRGRCGKLERLNRPPDTLFDIPSGRLE